MLQPGELIQPKDAVYNAASDQWTHLNEWSSWIRTRYNPDLLGPVRRFNKPKKESE
jgi:hypothetical protein